VSDDERDWENYQSGPFCRHWSDPADCDILCATCGHKCHQHEFEAPGACMMDGCACEAWNEGENK
jgi:hypothetical protein